jgi:hypothetical protein
VILLPPVERCVKQVAERTGHGFTDEAPEDAQRVRGRFIAKRHVLGDPVGSVDALVDWVSVTPGRGDLRYSVK